MRSKNAYFSINYVLLNTGRNRMKHSQSFPRKQLGIARRHLVFLVLYCRKFQDPFQDSLKSLCGQYEPGRLPTLSKVE